MVATSGVILFFLWLSNIPMWREPDKDMYHVTPLYVEPKKKDTSELIYKTEMDSQT